MDSNLSLETPFAIGQKVFRHTTYKGDSLIRDQPLSIWHPSNVMVREICYSKPRGSRIFRDKIAKRSIATKIQILIPKDALDKRLLAPTPGKGGIIEVPLPRLKVAICDYVSPNFLEEKLV
jgi:hypothetical protein